MFLLYWTFVTLLLQGLQQANSLRDERGKVNVVIVDEGEESKQMSKEELEVS